ncbi:hypothetical protein BGW38_001884 [Lunasporangiospora selenospora]|uniref:Ribonuclease P/MRP protein subunit POP5 n=1 Tax=Lunasporangiospora selenospora TaxID=979761 RepID=A0A9P6G3C1_9FUNG|nr:hypothetical protein BGW38_001884 [Lunasporangiospora selenospora]
MVRFKNRYLLFEIIYSNTPLGWTSIPAATSTAKEVANLTDGPDQTPFGDTGRNQYRLPPLSNRDLVNAIKDSISENFGDYGAGLIGKHMILKYFSSHTNIGIFRVARDDMHVLWGALTFITVLNGNSCMIKVLHTAGTISHCQLMSIQYDRDRILFLRRLAERQKDNQAYHEFGSALKTSVATLSTMDM